MSWTRRRASFGVAAWLGALLATGCGDERALVLRLETEAVAEASLCLTAFDQELLFSERYAAADATGTLTFLAGDRTDETLRVAARLRRGGRVLAQAAGEGRFGAGGSSELRLRVARCAETTALPETPLGTSVGATGLLAADTDGDGRDELWLSHPEGVRVLGGSASSATRVLGVGDSDDDCLDDVLVADATGLLALPGGERLTASAELAVLADAGRGLGLATGDADGLRWGLLDGVMRSLTGQPVRDLAAADLDGDGVDDLVAVGEGGVAVFLGGPAGPVAAVGAAPTGWAGQRLALLDLDGDGVDDLAIADETRVRMARNRGDGLFEARDELAIEGVRALRAFDADGDCRDDLVVVADETRIHLGGEDARVTAGSSLGALVDVVAADVDGDGRRELVLLDAEGQVRTWSE
ncbi:MAG: VCBS repeat-containing protein [Sandaracinus sp.]|nr:VCBS repeat-containing protein [Myxococcales bacterium]MCB9618939.1 VCBS repeat-containing protein [Sandaracinus sp.]